MDGHKIPMINRALRLARVYWGYSQVELAECLGVTQPMISEIERGAKAVSFEMLERYSKGLGIRKSQLLFFAEEIEDQEFGSYRRHAIAGKTLSLLEKMRPNAAPEAKN